MQHKDAVSEFREVDDPVSTGILAHSNLAYPEPDGPHGPPVRRFEAPLDAVELIAALAARGEGELAQIVERFVGLRAVTMWRRVLRLSAVGARMARGWEVFSGGGNESPQLLVVQIDNIERV